MSVRFADARAGGEAEALARAAAAMVGARFRLKGRDPAGGLDCAGLVLAALGIIGRGLPASFAPPAYAMKMRALPQFADIATMLGFVAVTSELQPGDVLLFHVGPCQYHLAIVGPEGGFIHAHAGLRRVIATPSLPKWAIAGHWRLAARDRPAPPQ